MSKKYENGLFIFRRDLRVVDNKGLYLANSVCKQIHPVFIFTPEQVTNSNAFKSENAVQFMIESLQDLSSQIDKMGGKLNCFYGENAAIIEQIIKEFNIEVVCFNTDYSPYAVKRDASIIKLCKKLGVSVETKHDYCLQPPGTIVNGAGTTYQKFTPFYQTALREKVDAPMAAKHIHFSGRGSKSSHTITLANAFRRFTAGTPNPDRIVRGGRQNAIHQIRIAAKNIKSYAKTRDQLNHYTSELSAHIKFGCVSVREVYKAFRSNEGFIRQLYWRDFYANVMYSFPQVIGSAMKPNYRHIQWNHNAGWFKKWCDGMTGFPVIDAGMRQLNATGYMHNRARLLVACFLVKTLLISWEKGERYFAQKLTDYDPASNNGNWQWIAGTGADSQPYFRVFSPWEQAKHYDSDCEYIKKWVPELEKVPNEDVLKWDEKYSKYSDVKYPKPMVDYREQKEAALKMYSSAFH
jgi:deoxyribodipyrimidine photo-lyase